LGLTVPCPAADWNPVRLRAQPIDDPSEVRSRVQSLAAGVRLVLFSTAAGLIYTFATFDGPHRPSLFALWGTMAVFGLLTWLLPHERIVRSRHRETFFLLWSVGQIALIGLLAASDGGTKSPLALLFFLPVAFAALSYPLLSVVLIGAVDVLTFVGVGLAATQPAPDPVHLGFFATCLAITAVMCAWEANDHERQRDDLARISRADPLTGCLNRRGFEERLDAEIDSGMRTGRRTALVVLDLDHFKDVNDTRGHDAGDKLLRWVVETTEEILRPMDSLGRLGGDEFAILVPGAGPVEGQEVAQRVQDALAVRVGVSTGIASFPADGADRDELHRYADADLYAAKNGRKPDKTPGSRELSWAAALARAVDLRMSVPDEHSTVVAHYAAAIAQRIGWNGAELAMLRMAAMLHDVGKVSVPDRILRKPGPLSLEEYEQIKDHPVAGAEIVAQIDGLQPIVDWIRHSHEHVDGSGYPDGLIGEDIPMASRVLLVADAFDAMTSHRPYGAAMPPDIALEELRANAGKQFDARCVAALDAYLTEAAAAGESATLLDLQGGLEATA
jgi:diguanylate cyclase (GGDEF)-like protein/putative nucleotidyltransferase with HDIG domain